MGKDGMRIGVIALVLVVAVCGAWYVYRTHHAASQAAPSDKNPPILGPLQSVTPASVTILVDGSPKTFAVSTTTKIIDQVLAGEVGKTLSEVAPGTLVMIEPHAKGSGQADTVTVLIKPILSNTDPAGPPMSAAGFIVATSSKSITVKTAASTTVEIMTDGNTAIMSDVLPGKKGKTLADIDAHTYVEVGYLITLQGLRAVVIELFTPLTSL